MKLRFEYVKKLLLFFLEFYLFPLTIFHDIILLVKCFACTSLHVFFLLCQLQMFENTGYSLLVYLITLS